MKTRFGNALSVKEFEDLKREVNSILKGMDKAITYSYVIRLKQIKKILETSYKVTRLNESNLRIIK